MPADVTWHEYPADVPVGDRAPCSSPGCHQPAVAVQTRTWLPTLTNPGPNFMPETTMRPFCAEHATALGWDGNRVPMPPQHLNAFQRWVVRVLEHRDDNVARA
ncbi:MAG TPA: hypothetical protein VFH66_10535 [Mycobacteriales bacterium]|nr:hypothetical protein [Mycobacteriales bacterium]